jgi:cytoskeletal protein CcmA (bactofilin family)
VGGTFRSTQPLRFGTIKVGGKVELAGGEGGDIHVGGILRSDGDLSFGTIKVGGESELLGSCSGVNASVGGLMDVRDNLSLSGSLKVGGKAEIGQNVQAGSIKVGGHLTADKAEAVNEIETQNLRTRLGARAGTIDIKKKGEVEGPLVAGKVTIGERARVEDVHGDFVELRAGVRARNVYAAEVIVESGSRVQGQIKYTRRIEAEDGAVFAQEPERVEELPPKPI